MDAPEHDRPPLIALTMGDPRGIGPEIILRVLREADVLSGARLMIVGSGAVLQREAADLDFEFDLPVVSGARQAAEHPAALLDLDNFPADRLTPRQADAESGRASIEYIETAVRLTHHGPADALVTAPINKEALAAAGCRHAGHTEMLAELTGAGPPTMLMVSARLRVALVTTHLALRAAPDAVSSEGIVTTIRTLDQGLRKFFGIEAPRLAVCGLNPHCSDGGRFGDEEARIIRPALREARRSGIEAAGPFPADVVFAHAARGQYDAVVAMYHDQGLIPVKLEGLHEVVNVTLGLPIIRTSVGHGTAYDIAGTGRADQRSLARAIRLAVEMCRRSGRRPGFHSEGGLLG
ncbi:MAG: 4-hydroxythreonine-4-phosphate dehydrogenase PdxA [Planctomycetes bacterium]|nr:4-hydroxythreonine-4-phosphate dehydrogenase PdxA [Planctomycetota bacterium]